MKRRTLASALTRAAASAGEGGRDDARARRVVPVEIGAIREDGRRRAVDAETVAMLAESLSAIGLQAPIVVRADPDDRGALRLVAGSHRLAAARRLGWRRIDALVTAADDDEAALIEIDENLVRAELRPLERAQFLVERRAIHRRLHPDLRPGRPRSGAGGEMGANIAPVSRGPFGNGESGGESGANGAPVSFENEAGRLTGLSRRGVYRALEIGDGLHPPLAEALADTPIADREGDLHRISRKDAGEQERLLGALRDADEAPRTLAELEREPEERPSRAAGGAEARLAALKRAWHGAGPGERKAFLDWVERGRGRSPPRGDSP